MQKCDFMRELNVNPNNRIKPKSNSKQIVTKGIMVLEKPIKLHSAHLLITANVTELRQNTLKCTWSDADYCASFSFFISGLFGYKFYIQSPRVKMAL